MRAKEDTICILADWFYSCRITYRHLNLHDIVWIKDFAETLLIAIVIVVVIKATDHILDILCSLKNQDEHRVLLKTGFCFPFVRSQSTNYDHRSAKLTIQPSNNSVLLLIVWHFVPMVVEMVICVIGLPKLINPDLWPPNRTIITFQTIVL